MTGTSALEPRPQSPQRVELHESAIRLSDALSQLADGRSAPYDPLAARLAISEAMEAWPGPESEQWSRWVAEAGRSLGLRVRPVDASWRQAQEWVHGSGQLLTRAEPGHFVALLGPSGRKMLYTLVPSNEKPQPIGARQLVRTLGQDLDTVRRWVVIEPDYIGPDARSQIQDHHHDHDDHHHHGLPPIRRLMALLKPEMTDIWVLAVYAMVLSLLGLSTPIAVESLVGVVAFGRFFQPVLVISIILGVFLLFAAVTRMLQAWVAEILQRRIFARTVADLAWRLPRVDMHQCDREFGPELTNRFFDVITIQKAVSTLLLDGLTIVLAAGVGMVVLASYHPFLLGFDLFLLALIAFTIFILGRGAIRSAVDESVIKYRTAAWLEDLTRCPAAFRTEGAGEYAMQASDRLTSEYLLARQDHFTVLFRQLSFALLLQAVASTALLGLGGWLVIQGQLTLGQLVAAELIVAIILGSVAKLGKHMETFYDLCAAVDKVGVLLDLPLEREDGTLATGWEGAAEVRFCGLEPKPHIVPLNETIGPCERVALYGPSCTGKSSVLEYCFGSRVAAHGYVELDGTDVRDIRPEALRRHVALAASIEVLDASIEENVRLGRAEITDLGIRDALRRAGVLEDILSLHKGLKTRLGRNGRPLSGSQLSRLMIARALAGRPRLLLISGLLDGLSDEDLAHVANSIPGDDCTLIVSTGQKRVTDYLDRVIVLERAHAS